MDSTITKQKQELTDPLGLFTELNEISLGLNRNYLEKGGSEPLKAQFRYEAKEKKEKNEKNDKEDLGLFEELF
ncbi:MAG: hypothetical protein ACP5P2_01380 [Candidatus Micrarchaeia archaeon]|jgi:hypothetical protein